MCVVVCFVYSHQRILFDGVCIPFAHTSPIQQQRQLLEQTDASASSRVFKLRLNNTFLYALSSCDKNIRGCYEPSCAHAEKPIEVESGRANSPSFHIPFQCGLKVQNRLWSLYDDTETEIESVETGQ